MRQYFPVNADGASSLCSPLWMCQVLQELFHSERRTLTLKNITGLGVGGMYWRVSPVPGISASGSPRQPSERLYVE